MGCHVLLQRIFLTQGSNLGLLHCRQILYQLSAREAPYDICIFIYVAVVVKNLPANVGDARDGGLIPVLRRSHGVGNVNTLQYCC